MRPAPCGPMETSVYWAEGGEALWRRGCRCRSDPNGAAAAGGRPQRCWVASPAISRPSRQTESTSTSRTTGESRSVPVEGGAVEKLGAAAVRAVTDICHRWGLRLLGRISPGALRRIPVGGGTPTPLVDDAAVYSPETVRVDSTSAYWIGRWRGLQKVPKGGGTPTSLGVVGGLSDIAVDVDDVFYATDIGSIARYPLLAARHPSAARRPGPSGRPQQPTALYWVSQGGVSVRRKRGAPKRSWRAG